MHTYKIVLTNSQTNMPGTITVKSWCEADAKQMALNKLSSLGFNAVQIVKLVA